MNNYIQTASGKKFFSLNPNPRDMDINDIAAALSKICRFKGHCRKFYSVAQHSVYLSRLMEKDGCPLEDVLWGLLHDAAEAYSPFGDVPRPYKHLFPQIIEVEDRLDAAVAEHFGLGMPRPEAVGRYDLVMLATERRDLMMPTEDVWECLEGVEAIGHAIYPWRPETAELAFLEEFNRIVKERK